MFSLILQYINFMQVNMQILLIQTSLKKSKLILSIEVFSFFFLCEIVIFSLLNLQVMILEK